MKQKTVIPYRGNLPVLTFAIYSAFVFLVFTHCLSDNFNLPKFVVALTGIVIFLTYFAMKFLNIHLITLYKNPLYIPLGFFILWKAFCLIFATNKIAGLSEIGLFLTCSALIFIVPLILRNFEDIALFMKILVGSSIIISLYGIIQHCGLDFFQWDIKNSALSTLGRRNFAGEYLVLILPWALFVLSISKKPQKIFFALTFIALLVHLFLTFTRASWIGFAISMLVVLLALLKFRLKPDIKKIVLISFIFLTVFRVYAGVFRFEPGTVKSRIEIWKTSIELIKNRFIWGYGTGNFEVAYYRIASERQDVLIPQNLRVDKAHNEFLEIAVENGFIGLFLFIFFIFTIYKMAWRIFTSTSEKKREKFVSIFAIASISGILVNSLASFPLQTTAGCFFFFLNCGVLSRMYFTVLEQDYVEKKFSCPGVAFICMAALCAVITLSFAGLYSNYSLEKSKRIMRAVVRSANPVLWLLAEMYAKNAASYNPFNVECYFHLGKLYLVADNLESAYINFSKALRFNPFSEQILMNLGIVEQRRKNYQQAEKYLLKAFAVAKNNPEVLKALGLFYFETKNYDRAIEILEKANNLLPDDVQLLKYIAMAYQYKGDILTANRYEEKINKLRPGARIENFHQ